MNADQAGGDWGTRSVARIRLARGGLRLKEMILASPPRIVLDVIAEDGSPAVTTAAATAASKPEPSTSPSPTSSKPSSSTAGSTASAKPATKKTAAPVAARPAALLRARKKSDARSAAHATSDAAIQRDVGGTS